MSLDFAAVGRRLDHLKHARDTARRAAAPMLRRRELLSFDATLSGLQRVGQHYAGIRAIPVECIVGSLDRATDFDRDFRPRGRAQRERMDTLRRAFRHKELPVISVYELDGQYFISDGHHRVALAHERGMLEVDAEVIHIRTRSPHAAPQSEGATPRRAAA